MRPALKLAFDLFDFPSQARAAPKAPLPPDLVSLLRIAAGEEDTLREAVRASGRPPRIVRDAAGFFIEQVMLFPEADSYRVLGARLYCCAGCIQTSIRRVSGRFSRRASRKPGATSKRPSGGRRTTGS